eukprot:11907118-Ditylum_brightwellii.AAC.1
MVKTIKGYTYLANSDLESVRAAQKSFRLLHEGIVAPAVILPRTLALKDLWQCPIGLNAYRLRFHIAHA